MRILYILLIAFVNSFDNIGVRVAYSVGGIKVQALKNLLISFMAFLVAFTASYSGTIAAHFLSEEVSSILSMLLLVGMGVNIILEPFLKKGKVERKEKKTLSYKEAASIGTALALDDIGGAVSVGLIGFNPFVVGIAFFIVSYLIFLSGNYAIKIFSKVKIQKKTSSMFAGGILILLGFSQVFM